MALIQHFEHVHKDSNQVHGTVDCGWLRFERNGSTYLQLDTYGSRERKILGKVSQSIQLDAGAASELVRIIRQTFPQSGL